MSLENKAANKCDLYSNITAMEQKAYGTLASSEQHTKIADQLVKLFWTARLLFHFEKEMRITQKVHALIAVP